MLARAHVAPQLLSACETPHGWPRTSSPLLVCRAAKQQTPHTAYTTVNVLPALYAVCEFHVHNIKIARKSCE
jgi:hypothetical protein